MPRSQDRLHSGIQKVMLERDLSNESQRRMPAFSSYTITDEGNYRKAMVSAKQCGEIFVILLRIHRPDIYAYICACIHIYLHLYMDMSISNVYIHIYIFNFSVDN